MLSSFVRFSIKNHKWIMVGSILLLALGLWIAKDLVVDSDIEGMMPVDTPSLQAYQAISEEFGGQEQVLVVVEGPGEVAEPFLAILAENLLAAELVASATYQMDYSFLETFGHLYLPLELYKQIETELDQEESPLSVFLADPGFAGFVTLLDARLEDFSPEERGELILALSGLVTGEQAEASLLQVLTGPWEGSEDLSHPQSEYLVSPHGGVYLMITRPGVPLMDQIARDAFFSGVTTQIEVLLSSGEYPGVRAGYTGGTMVTDYESDKVAFENFLSTALMTFAAILLLIILAFRRVGLLLASGLPLLLGTVLTSAFAVLAFGSLNLFSISFAVLLLGLGIDFAIHILARYMEERGAGASLEEALTQTLCHTGGSILAGALTTATALVAFVFADFPALRQTGIISSVGILLAVAAMMGLMPSLIAWTDRRQAKAPKNVEFTFLAPVGRWITAGRWAVVGSVLLLSVLLWGNLRSTTISADFTAMAPQGLPSEHWLHLVQEHFDYDPDGISLMADDLAQLEDWVHQLRGLPAVAKVESILDYLPEDQEEKIAGIQRIQARLGQGISSEKSPQDRAWAAALALEHLIERAESLGVSSQDLGVLGATNSALRSAMGPLVLAGLELGLSSELGLFGDVELRPMDVVDLPSSLTDGLWGQTGKFLIEVHAHGRIWDGEVLDALATQIAGVSPSFSGLPFLVRDLVDLVREDVIRVSLIASLAILLILWIVFGSLRTAFIVMIPVVTTLYLLLGIRPLVGFDLNFINLMAIPLIIGIAVDNGVHIGHRTREDGLVRLPEVLVHTGKAVTMTTMTTLIGFGSLMFSNHPGLVTIGQMVGLGMGLALALTLLLLPALLAISGEVRKYTPVQEAHRQRGR